MTASSENAARLEAAQATSHARSRQFLDELPPDLSAWDDRIESELARENSSLRSKLGKVYRLVDATSEAAAPFVACKRGCSACCHMNVSITLLEAERLSAATGRRMAVVTTPIKHDEATFSGTPCPFLVNDECSVYESRPFACRKHRSFDVDSYWCQPERSFGPSMGMVRLGGAEAAYAAIAAATKLGGFADIRDFFPTPPATYSARPDLARRHG